MFRKDRKGHMVGLALYAECGEVANLAQSAQEVLKNGRPRKSVWRALVHDTLERLGGSATLDEIYRAIEPRRSTSTAFWHEKVRQQLQMFFVHRAPGQWALAA
jgi:adenine-specific DNA-methyltransferase